MDEKKNYDVFISYSRKDYVDSDNNIIPGNAISVITETLEQNNIKCWFDQKGIYIGQEFASIIFDAIRRSKILLFVSSKNSNSNEAIWPKREICEANIYEKYIIPCRIDNSDYHRSIAPILTPLNTFQFYNERQNDLKKIIRSINKYREELSEKQRKIEEKNRQEQVRQEIKAKADEFKIHAARQDALRNEIIDLFKKIGEKNKKCPICGKSVSLETTYCELCGWPFPELPSLSDDKSSLSEGLFDTIRNNWRCINDKTESKERVKVLDKDNKSLQRKIEKISQKNEEYKKIIESQQSKIDSLSQKLKQEKEDSDKELIERITSLESLNNELQKKLEKRCEDDNKKPQTKQICIQRQSPSQKSQKSFKHVSEIYDFINNRLIPHEIRKSVFPSDSIQIINLQKFITYLEIEYGLEFTQKDFNKCRKISDLVDIVAKKAHVD